MVSVTVDGHRVAVPKGTTIWDAAGSAGVRIPGLCHDDRYDPVGVCRVCVVDAGQAGNVPACLFPCEEGMEIRTATAALERHRATLLRLLVADRPGSVAGGPQDELTALAERYGVSAAPELPAGSRHGEDASHPVIAMSHDACILCARCIRACDDVLRHDVIGRSGRGRETRIAFDLGARLGESSCVGCGACAAACPTGALHVRSGAALATVPATLARGGPGAPTRTSAPRAPASTAARNGRPWLPGTEARSGRFPGPDTIPALLDIQRRHGWLPRDELDRLSRRTRRPLYEIEGLVSFYPHLRAERPRRVEVAVCRDLACWLNGAARQVTSLRARYGSDVDIDVREVSCLGQCDRAPAVAVCGRPASGASVGPLVETLRRGPRAPVRLARAGRRFPNDPYEPGEDRYRVLRRALDGGLDAAGILRAVSASGLRGMGGAGFPAGAKWERVARQKARFKYVIANAHEGEPGTFKDREILLEQPHLVLEGLLLAMLACGAEDGWLFLRHEYRQQELALQEELGRLHGARLIGTDLARSGRRLGVEIFRSPGGYVVGEESALLECLEGHRGEPRNKPPFPSRYGLWGMPTLINSVETLASVPIILERGARWWMEQGVNGAQGLKFFAVSGHVERPGVHCLPLGTTARQLIHRAGGVKGGAPVAAFQPGGASSRFLGSESLDVPLDHASLRDAGSMLGSGGLVVMAEDTDLLAAATNLLRFFREESCGKCVPCRLGSDQAHSILTDLLQRGAGVEAVDGRIAEIEETMRETSICGLGRSALAPLMSVLDRR